MLLSGRENKGSSVSSGGATHMATFRMGRGQWSDDLDLQQDWLGKISTVGKNRV